MEEDLIIKKIYINDYIINTSLLKNSISKLLINSLSNKFYKNNQLENKVNNILDKIENIFIKTNSGDKIFNLSYQPYNQYNITHNYNNNNFNKKWIIPIINETKILNQNKVKIKNFDYYNTDSLLIENDENNYTYLDEDIDIKSMDNDFIDENYIKYKTENINILGNNTSVEIPVLSNNEYIYKFNDPDNITISKSSNKVIRTKTDINKDLYIITSNGQMARSRSDPSGVKEIDKQIEETFYEVHNILIDDNINIKQFLILNPLKLIHTNYNITLGNTISYLNEIMNTTYINIDTIIKNYDNNLDNLNLQFDDNIIESRIVDKDELSNQYNNDNNFIYDYLKIIKNLDKFEDQIYSIRILKHIYNIFGYDLNKIPHCYIEYLQNILNSNINNYINNNVNLSNYLFNKFKLYKSSLTNKIPEFIQYISKLYNIDDITYNENESIFNILNKNTHDNGFLYYLESYKITYLNPEKIRKMNLPILDTPENESIKCNFRIVKRYNSLNDYNSDTNRFIDLNYSLDNYLIEYDDLIYNLQHNTIELYNFKNNIYQQNKKIINDNDDKSSIKPIEDNESINNFILENKLYILNLLLNSFDINIVFTKFVLLKYKNKRYFQIPYSKIQEENIILIDKKPYQYENDSLKEINMNLDELNKQIKLKCNQNNIEINNANDLNKFYKDLNNFDIEKHNTNISKLIDIYKNDNEFKNFLLSKSISYTQSQLYFKNIEKIIYPITTNDHSKMINYLLNYNLNSIKSSNFSEENLLDEISNSQFNSEYIKEIRTISDNINNSSGKKMWNYIHHYVNEYELLTNVIVDGDKYNRAYYKMWEILLDNKIIDKPNFQYIALAEAPGNFVKCVKNLKSPEWNDFIICTLLNDMNTVNQGNFFDKYKNSIFGNSKGNLKLSNTKDKDFNGNLTKSSDINIFINYVETNNLYADLITADGGLQKSNNIDYLLEEYNHLPLFLGEIITALFTQKIDGTFILKMYDMVYNNSVNLLNLLSSFYNNVYITKPYSSRPCNTEKYIVCSNFKGISSNKSDKDKILNNLLSILDNLDTKPESYKHFNIFDKLVTNEKNISEITEFNNSIIVKTQLLHLQDIYDIIKKNDKIQLNLIMTYFGPKRNYNIKNILSNDESIDKGYFIKKIESCIILALYLKIKNQPLKEEYINYYSLIKNMKDSVLNTNIYPPHFKKIYEIRKEENKKNQVNKINKFVKQYCIVFEKPGEHKIIDYNILRTVEHFLLNKDIINLDHYVINKFRQNKTDLNKLHNYLEALCKSTDIKKLFYLQSSSVISLIKNFQNTIRSYLGYYLCKYTYIPIYPKYKTMYNVIDQVEKYGILYNSQYICYYSGDKFDMEEFDDFMGDSIFRSNNISLFDEVTSNNQNITYISKNIYNNDLNIEQNICSFILTIDEFGLDMDTKLDIINKLHYIYRIDILDNTKDEIRNNYNNFEAFISSKHDKHERILMKEDVNLFKLSQKDLKKNKFSNNIKTEFIINVINKNPSLFSKENLGKLDYLFVKILFSLRLSDYFNNNYINIIIYTLLQIKNNKNYTTKKIFDIYIKYESNLLNFIYKESDLFQIFKNKLLDGYSHSIKLPEFSNENKDQYNNEINLDTIFNLNNEVVKNIITNHIHPSKNNWIPNKHWNSKFKLNKQEIDNNYKKLNESTTVLEFLENIPFIDFGYTYKHINLFLKNDILKKSQIETLGLLKYLSNYFTFDQFNKCIDLFNDDIMKSLTFNSVNNIENNIIDNREQLVNKNLLNYKNNSSVFVPNYTPSIPILYNSEENYIYNCIKYLYLYVYEDKSFIGKKRIFDNDICLYTNRTKSDIIASLTELSNTSIKDTYNIVFNSNHKIINNSEFVNKNILDESFISLIYNTVYKIDNKYIDIFYNSLRLFYLQLTENSSTTTEPNATTAEPNITDKNYDLLKNIIMRYYNDPITNIMLFLDEYRDKFINYINSNILINDILNKLEESKDTTLFNIISDINMNNLDIIKSNLISQIRIYVDQLKEYNIDINYELTIKDIILLTNNIKKSISYISNISTLDITSDLKNNKYKNIKKQYLVYEYDSLINIVKNSNYNYKLSEFNNSHLDYIHIVFTEILQDFNYNFKNIYSLDEEITKLVLLFKLCKIFNNCIYKLNNDTSFGIDSNLKNKYHIFENKIQQIKLTSMLLDQEELSISNTDKKYFNLFISIIKDNIDSINNYSSVINKLNPDKYINDEESMTFDNNDYGDVTDTYDGGLEDSVEE